jgi:tRNA pseudouridine55 synthase
MDSIRDWLDGLHKRGGTVLIDKPAGWTSFDVVAKLRNLLRIKKIGHAGTLDPLATGLLIICCGKHTKTIDNYVGLEKEYTGEIKLGATTISDDSEFEEENITPLDGLSEDEIKSAAMKLTGTQMQVPPKFSARKHKGKRMYKLAREGVDFEPEPKEITIYSFGINEIELPIVKFKIRCSKGTYIRSAARDLGEITGKGAYLKSLRRTSTGNFVVDDAFAVDEFAKLNLEHKPKSVQ